MTCMLKVQTITAIFSFLTFHNVALQACRAQVRVLVKDTERTQKEFGPYVTAVQGDVNTGSSLKKVMKGAKAVIICGPVGQSARAAAALGLTHIVLPSALGTLPHSPHMQCSIVSYMPEMNVRGTLSRNILKQLGQHL